MTEVEWLACDDPQRMLEAVGDRVTERKRRLVLIACCRRLLSLFRQEVTLRAVGLGELLAEGGVPLKQARHARREVFSLLGVLDGWREEDAEEMIDGFWGVHFDDGPGHLAQVTAAIVAARAVSPDLTASHLGQALKLLADTQPSSRKYPRHQQELEAQATLLREVIGNPFHRVAPDPSLRRHALASLAEAAYQHRLLPSGELESARLAVLSDALEEAGCTDAELLSHLRLPGPHVRGCWAVDLVLGRE
jgi:hypothetical protein